MVTEIFAADIGLSCQLHTLLNIDWCSLPIRFFIVSLMYNNSGYLVIQNK